MSNELTPEKALIFRIVHVDNLPWLLRNGLPCRNSSQQHPAYRTIGNPELIERRRQRDEVGIVRTGLGTTVARRHAPTTVPARISRTRSGFAASGSGEAEVISTCPGGR